MRTLALAAVAALAAAPASAQVFINELRIDQIGTDNDEYFELVGPAGTSLSGFTYLVLGDGLGSGTIEAVVNLTGQSIPPSGFFVAAEGSFTLGAAAITTNLNFENDDNVTHMLVTGFTGSVNADLDTNDDGVLDNTPFTAIADVIAVIHEANPPTTTEFHYGPPTVGPKSSADVPEHVYRSPDGKPLLSSGFNIGVETLGVTDSPGSANPATRVSVATGGTQTLLVDAGAANAGNFYILLTGASGTTPGTPVNPVLVPLNFDGLVKFTLLNANSAGFSNTFGALDSNGRATAVLTVPSLKVTLAGITLNSAGLILGPLFGAKLATNAVPLALVP